MKFIIRSSRRTYHSSKRQTIIAFDTLERRALLSVAAVATIPNGGAGSNDYLLSDNAGNIYGYTASGGQYGYGSVYELQSGVGTPITLASLDGSDIDGDLGFIEGITVLGDGTIYGIDNLGPPVFEIPAGGGSATAVITNANDPGSGLSVGALTSITSNSDGVIYFTSSSGGQYGDGSIDQMIAGSSAITVVASFNGDAPDSHIVLDSKGNVFGVAGANAFEVPGGDGNLMILGTVPTDNRTTDYLPLAVDDSDNLFGVEPGGGADGVGSVWALYSGAGASATIGTFTGGADGAYPNGVVLDGDTLFGVTTSGGQNQDGTLFSVAASGVSNGAPAVTILTSFDSTDASPFGGLVVDNGGIYGVTADNAPEVPNQVVFRASTEKDAGGGSDGGGGGSAGDGNTSSLSTTVAKSTVPTAIVSGGKSKAKVDITITNSSAAKLSGLTTVELFASTDGAIDSASIPLGTFSNKKLVIAAGKSKSAPISIKTFPADLSGTYTILTQITDPSKDVGVASTGLTFTATTPFVSLAEASTTTLAVPLAGGAAPKGAVTLTIKNNGNVASSGITPINITASTTQGVAGTSIAMESKKKTIQPGKSIKITVPIKSAAALPAGNYFIVTEVTDPLDNQTSITTAS